MAVSTAIASPSDSNLLRYKFTSPYKYSKLDQTNQHIRLLRVRPAADAPSFRQLGQKWDLPNCNMEIFKLDQAPPYIALSYVWGDKSSGTAGILLDGQKFEITTSLYIFLDLFRSDTFSQEVAYIWIDQICIDQSDLDERSYAVRFMSSVYSNAEYVVVWLGDDEETEKAAKAFYFTRLWIIQELLLARTVIINCRETWGLHLSSVQFHVQKYQDKIYSRIRNPSLFLLWDSVYNREGRHLAQCLQRYCQNDCQDPRDKVYALLGLVKAEEQVPIDYSKSVSEVYIDTLQILARRWWLQTPTDFDNIGRPAFIGVAVSLAKEMFTYASLPGLWALLRPVRSLPGFKWYIKVFQHLSEHEQRDARKSLKQS
ncbi:heterokaryon incompatibility protein-domain-containing protein [Paraphoma chrysanthemicola]|uniref:Heterokaryon incompatibility protein-domain-containing protein n=1 Tax=Paraphoma chrysanthemicola TaxID=798071 RepID=A0A8K0VVB2_9PLEO|nr:heterokaryon incompatibility protein-domain-containing protein [Paraphoma chrysanthemicola]